MRSGWRGCRLSTLLLYAMPVTSVCEILLMAQLAEQCAEFLSSEVMVGCLGMVPVSKAGHMLSSRSATTLDTQVPMCAGPFCSGWRWRRQDRG